MEALGALWAESARTAFTTLLPPDHPFPEPRSDRMRAAAKSGEVSLLVADEDGELAGFVICGPMRDSPERGVGELQSFFVATGRWRRGTGRALMAAALADLAERGYGRATVWSFDTNERANAFYEAHGFTRDGATRTEEPWAHIPEVRYRRDLP